ncbi:BtpA/SgcQ family protein [Olsenella porci]|uniref:BtpA/SgcQ family protein n=1 Tax=Olsenella porci TaxID=2652279 RepID=A0A6N7XAL1_9ACTN|nr:BtpA/SgcQ family protein [Olsenella porci]MST72427.1 BtpA/SgcQ family protein [Olsenella porci]
MWINEMFGTKKPIIAMLHLDPLPGDPRFGHDGGGLSDAVEHAKRDLDALQEGGVDGVIVSNEFSLPYQRHMDFVTPASMAYIVGQLKSQLSVPFGVDAISDGLACIELAAACEANFVRGTFSGVYVGDGGLYNNDFSMLMRRKAALHLDDLKMLYFINPESDRNLDTRELSEIASSTIFKVHPDGLCVSATAAGSDVNTGLIASVKKKNPEVAVLVNTGCRPDTIREKLSVCDAAVVGTYFKEGGLLEDENLNNVRVDVNRVREFMKVVRDVRSEM